MRTYHLFVIALFLVILGLAPGVSRAQAVPRTDTPRAGTFRVTFEPVITTWEQEFTSGRRRRIGASLTDTLPPGAAVFVRAERRVTPLAVDFGITNRIAVGFRLPLVRVMTRAAHRRDSTGAIDSAAARLDSVLTDTTYAYAPLATTPRWLRFFPGDVEVEAKYRILEAPNYALSGTLLVRLPTGHQDSPRYLFDISAGDHQTDIELQVAQELTLLHRLWVNAALRLGRQQAGTRERRVGPQTTLLIPQAATTRLEWDPGDYVAIDIAPMYRFSRSFAVGVTAGYWTKAHDRYAYRSAQDSIDLATRLGAPVPAGVLDGGTAQSRTRFGAAMTYVSADMEGSLSIEQTVSGGGGGGGALVPAATVFRILMRTSRWPF